MAGKANLDNIHMILVEPQIPENIGSVARAMTNMGITHLVLVKPKNCDLSRVVKMATGSSVDVIGAQKPAPHFGQKAKRVISLEISYVSHKKTG